MTPIYVHPSAPRYRMEPFAESLGREIIVSPDGYRLLMVPRVPSEDAMRRVMSNLCAFTLGAQEGER